VQGGKKKSIFYHEEKGKKGVLFNPCIAGRRKKRPRWGPAGEKKCVPKGEGGNDQYPIMERKAPGPIYPSSGKRSRGGGNTFFWQPAPKKNGLPLFPEIIRKLGPNLLGGGKNLFSTPREEGNFATTRF